MGRLMEGSEDTIIGLGTPEGRSALAVIRISGPRAFDIVEKVSKGSIKTAKGTAEGAAEGSRRHLQVRHLHIEGRFLDKAVISLFFSPHSYTGEDMAEISCHGSAYVVRTLLHTLSAQGARVAVAGEFTRRAFVHGKLDLPQAEAVADLIEAEGEASHTLAVSQLRGNISAMVQTFRDADD